MEKNTSAVTNNLKRKDMYYADPGDLEIATAPDAVLYDERAEKPAAERMVLSVMVNGVIEPIVVRKNGTRIEVIDGRQRARAAVEANRRLVAQGQDAIKVPLIFQKGDPGDLAKMMVILNEIREDDGVLVKAKKAKRLADRGKSEAEIAEAFGVTTTTIGNWSKLLDCAPRVQKLVDDGSLRLADARVLAKLTEDEQIAEAAKVMEKAPTRKTLTEKGEKKKRVANPAGRFRRLQSFYSDEANRNELPSGSRWAQQLIGWLMGDVSGQALVDEYPVFAPVVKAPKKTKKAA